MLTCLVFFPTHHQTGNSAINYTPTTLKKALKWPPFRKHQERCSLNRTNNPTKILLLWQHETNWKEQTSVENERAASRWQHSPTNYIQLLLPFVHFSLDNCEVRKNAQIIHLSHLTLTNKKTSAGALTRSRTPGTRWACPSGLG